MTSFSLLLAAAILALPPAGQAAPRDTPSPGPSARDPSAFHLPGRAADARVAGVAWRLATAGRARCPRLDPASALVLQHLSQFEAADRAAILAQLPLDRGPGVIAVVPGGPADSAGIRAGDAVLAIDGAAVPPEADPALPFDAERARRRADAIGDLLATARTVTLLRGRTTIEAPLAPAPACPSRVHLARSGQRNAFADGRHVFVTTGMLGELRNDDELAFVIAHEMAHNVLGHAQVMRGGAAGKRGAVRRIERAADLFGGALMLDAGFDPVAGALALTRFRDGAFGIELFARHDPPATRVAAMRALVAARRAP